MLYFLLVFVATTLVLYVTLLYYEYLIQPLMFLSQGAKCEIDIDECDSAPCQNGGLCKDGMGDFQCQCKPGFLGERPLRK